jgi:hypothetical protein
VNRARSQKPTKRRTRAASARARDRLRRSVDGWAERTSARAAQGPAIGLIGLDVSRPPVRLRTRTWVPIIAAAVVGAMFLAVLRMDVIRMRFALAQAFKEELRLEEVKRERTVRMRQLRDPAVLARNAERLGFRRAERLIDLDAFGVPPAMAPLLDPADSIQLASLTARRGSLRP